MVVTHESAPPKPKPKTGPSGANVPGKEKRLRSKEGCLTCRIRGKKCDQGKATDEVVAGNPPGCAACRRLRIECLGYARNRPEWLKGPQVDEFKRTIKMFLAENSPRVQRTPRPSDSGALPFLTFDSLRNGASTSFVPVAAASTSTAGAQHPASSSSPGPDSASAPPEFNPPPIPPTYSHAQYPVPVPMQFGPPPQQHQLPVAHPVQEGIPLDPALAIDPALEDANMQTLAPVLAQLGVIGRLRPVSASGEPQEAVLPAVGYTVSHDRGTPPASSAPAAVTLPAPPQDALHNIGVRVLEVLVAGGKPVEAAAVRAWAGVVGASPAWGDVVVELVGATRAEPGAPYPVPPLPPATAESLDTLGADALRACALMCLGMPGAERVLARRLEERMWGEDMVEAGVAETWQRAGEVFVGLAGAGVGGAAEAAVKLEARQGKGAEIPKVEDAVEKKEDADVQMGEAESNAEAAGEGEEKVPAVVPPTLSVPPVQSEVEA